MPVPRSLPSQPTRVPLQHATGRCSTARVGQPRRAQLSSAGRPSPRRPLGRRHAAGLPCRPSRAKAPPRPASRPAANRLALQRPSLRPVPSSATRGRQHLPPSSFTPPRPRLPHPFPFSFKAKASSAPSLFPLFPSIPNRSSPVCTEQPPLAIVVAEPELAVEPPSPPIIHPWEPLNRFRTVHRCSPAGPRRPYLTRPPPPPPPTMAAGATAPWGTLSWPPPTPSKAANR